jgi:hypothetical protein
MIDESYVAEIVRAVPKGISAKAFMNRCQPNINAGYGAEVEEAFRRSFRVVAHIDGPRQNNRVIYEPIDARFRAGRR